MFGMPSRRVGRAGSWALLLVLALTASPTRAEPPFPELTGRVVDRADILSASIESNLSQKLETHEDQTSNQVVVVTVRSLQGHTIEDYGYQLGRHWGIGQAERNNGVLLLVAPNERKVRIEVGYGLEGALTDAFAKTIIEREITPAFRKRDFDQGVARGVEAILAAVAGEYKAVPSAKTSSDGDKILLISAVLIVGLLIFFVLISSDEIKSGSSRSTTRRRRHSSDDDYDRTSSGYSRGGWSSGGGFRGGGGSFGGGGSSGSW